MAGEHRDVVEPNAFVRGVLIACGLTLGMALLIWIVIGALA